MRHTLCYRTEKGHMLKTCDKMTSGVKSLTVCWCAATQVKAVVEKLMNN